MKASPVAAGNERPTAVEPKPDADATTAGGLTAALERYESALLRYATRLTGSAESAREVVQDVFLRLVHERPAELNGRLPQWLYTVCRNRAIDVRRKKQRVTTVEIAEALLHRTGEDPAMLMERREEAGRVSAILATLPANQQEVVRLRFEHGLSYKQIAEVTGLSVSNVGFLMHTAMKTMREKMTRHEGT